MARIEECAPGMRVALNDGWGSPAVALGKRMNNRIEGTVAASPHKLVAEQTGPDIVQIRFDPPVRTTPNHRIVSISCKPEELVLL